MRTLEAVDHLDESATLTLAATHVRASTGVVVAILRAWARVHVEVDPNAVLRAISDAGRSRRRTLRAHWKALSRYVHWPATSAERFALEARTGHEGLVWVDLEPGVSGDACAGLDAHVERNRDADPVEASAGDLSKVLLRLRACKHITRHTAEAVRQPLLSTAQSSNAR